MVKFPVFKGVVLGQYGLHWAWKITEDMAQWVSITQLYSVYLGLYIHSGISYRKIYTVPWLCHDMETLSPLLALCEGNPLVTSGFPSQMARMESFDIFFVVSLNKLLNKQLSCQWFVMSWCSCDTTVMHTSTFYFPRGHGVMFHGLLRTTRQIVYSLLLLGTKMAAIPQGIEVKNRGPLTVAALCVQVLPDPQRRDG